MAEPRMTAVQALQKLHKQDGFSNLIFDRAMEESALDSRDRALTATLFYGVLERQLTLDYILGKFSSRSLTHIPLPVLEILRVGIYQLYFMAKIPAPAAVDEAVKLTKALGLESHSGFVNALLRAAAQGQKKLVYPDPKQNELRFLEVKHSCPKELISLWQDAYGKDHAAGLLKSLSGRPPLTVRVNTYKTTPEELRVRLEAEGVESRVSDQLPDALILGNVSAIEQLPAFREGFFHVQDMASQFCCRVLDPKPGERLYDVCAAPGGKSFTCAEKMENTGELRAFDQYPQKVALIEKGAARLELSMIRAGLRDAEGDTAELPPADRVLCDVPCSGLGAIRRKPEIRYTPLEKFCELPSLQLSILNRTAALVKAGGRLVYSTCTLNPAENGGVARAFWEAHPEFEPEKIECPAMVRAVDEPDNQWTLLPHIHGTDGFFMASFRKRR